VGTSRGVDADPLSFLPPSLPRLQSFLSILIFPSPVELARRRGLLFTVPSKNDSQLQKLEVTECTWTQRSPKLELTRPTGHIGGCAYDVDPWLPQHGR